ncbi:hypothetical protein GCM10010964_27040 [Caldovatus sediminis]|uniref:Uncharacterized protein n=1 Tax=Caldovatus sediminis TaxID=2041189 RepID=A0A8J2ZCK2_9PROT|nr:hypothetical protein [Caldovatus sediminis]GGG37791.1 hypothetical protein GCM10010964_27040 [Caldovatus sediminis]
MSVTVTSNVSMETAVVGTSEGTITEAEIYTLDLAFALCADGGDGGMALLVGGDAIALGENTLAAAGVTVVLTDGGSATEGYATAGFDAVAVSEGGGMAFASTVAFAEVSGDADRSFTMSHGTTWTLVADGTTATSSSTLSTTYALDVALSGCWAGGDAGAAYDPLPPPEAFDPLPLGGNDGCGGDPYASLDGNVAYFGVYAVAYGDNTALQVDALAFVLEDQLSNVTVVVAAAVY